MADLRMADALEHVVRPLPCKLSFNTTRTYNMIKMILPILTVATLLQRW